MLRRELDAEGSGHGATGAGLDRLPGDGVSLQPDRQIPLINLTGCEVEKDKYG